jgi:hypothetical protein
MGHAYESRSAESKNRDAAGASDAGKISIEDDEEIDEDILRVRVWCRKCGALRTGPSSARFVFGTGLTVR